MSEVRTVGLYTLGCKVSQYETEAIAEAFEAAGFRISSYTEPCDAYVINTCTVTAESDRKSRQIIRRAIQQNPSAFIAVVGCYAQRSPHEVGAIEGVSVVRGTADKLSVARLATRWLDRRDAGETPMPDISVSSLEGAPFERMCITRAPRTRAYVKIEDGCECRCTYCAIPDARGGVRSKAPEDVIREVEGLSRGGTREIVLTGIETASYGVDFERHYRLIDLIEELQKRGSCERIRLGSLSPEIMKEELVARLASLPILAPHFHLSMQSGSDGVLARMKRRYNSEMALSALRRVREVMPRVEFTTDLMVGFPGESEEEFLQTLDFVRKARFLDIHVFMYSRRRGTAADTFAGQVPEAVKRERSARLIALKNEIRDEILAETLAAGDALSAVLETYRDGFYHAHTDNFIPLLVRGEAGLQGQIVRVRPTHYTDGVLHGEILHQ